MQEFLLKCSILESLYIAETQTLTAISKAYSVPADVIKERLVECGIQVRSRDEVCETRLFPHRVDIDMEIVEYWYWDLNMTAVDIGKKLNVDPATIRSRLGKIRTATEAKAVMVAPSRKRRKRIRSIDRHWMCKMPEHPRADSQGYVKEVYLLWEKWYKEPFPADYRIHYINGNYDDLSKLNIRAMTNSAHSKFHAYARRRAGLGHQGSGVGGKCPDDLLAGYMVEWDELQEQEEIEKQIRSFDVKSTERYR